MNEDSAQLAGITIAPEYILNIASRFALPDPPDPLEAFHFTRKGNINQQTYWIKAGPRDNHSEYLLQLLNPGVFKQPGEVMDAMLLCIEAQRASLAAGRLPENRKWEIIRLVPTKEGNPYLEIAEENGLRCWRMMEYIRDTHTYKSLREVSDRRRQLQIAEEAGSGLALFEALTEGVDIDRIHCPLPGYRDTPLYYSQLHSILAGHRTPLEANSYLPTDAVLRQSTEDCFFIHLPEEEYQRRLQDPDLGRFIVLALEQQPFALTLSHGLSTGQLKRMLVHGDTKLENFLFSNATGKAVALVDLDTIMPHTWLTDWGDMVRSLINIAGERETEPGKIRIDLEVFEAVLRGFLSAAGRIPTREINLMVDAPQIMALELGVRFLADYLRGDTYFRLTPEDLPDLNKTRAIVQFYLFEDMRRNAGDMNGLVKKYARKMR
jgi:hypothetical protein